MRKLVFFLFITVFLFITLNSTLFCDEREENIDIFLVLDKSLSMEEEIKAVKAYIDDYIIDDLLIPGDMLVIIAFYGEAEIVVNDENVEPDEIPTLKDRVGEILADGRFTDIGNALDTLKEALERYENRDRKRYMLLLTDGIQEAPPESEYFTEDGSFNHAFLENTRTIQKEGWKIQVLGIGTASAAKQIAEQLAGEYSETSEEPTKEELVEKTEELLGSIRILGEVTLKPVDENGGTKINLNVESDNYAEQKKITITKIRLIIDDTKEVVVLNEPFSFTIEPASTREVTIPITIEGPLEAGIRTGTLHFSFSGEPVLIPAVTPVQFKVKSFIENNIWLIPVAIVLLAAIVFGIIFLTKSIAANKGLAFRVFVDNVPVTKEPVKLKQDEKVYLTLQKLEFSVCKQKEEGAIAELITDQERLKFSFLNHPEIKIMDDVPENILGEKIRIRLKGGYKTLLFRVA